MKNDILSQDRAKRLRAAGLRVTGPRLAILEALERDRRHPTAEMVHENITGLHPSVSLSTVYATLEALLRRGLIRRVAPHSGKLRVDGTTPDHDHATCRSCGSVFDISRDLYPRPPVPDRLPEGLRVTNLHLDFEVVCPNCNG